MGWQGVMLGKEVPTTTTIREGWGKGAFELRPDPCEQPQPKAWASSFFFGGGGRIIFNTFLSLLPHIVPVPILWNLNPTEPELQSFSLPL